MQNGTADLRRRVCFETHRIIGFKEEGENGFGYDSLFVSDDLGYGYHLPDRIIKPAKMVQTPTAGVLFLWVCRDSRKAAQGVQPLVAAKPPYRSAGKSPCAETSPRQSAHARKGV